MKTLTVLFLGLCCLIESGRAPRTVVVLDLKTATRVHGHIIQPHAAFIRVPKSSVIEVGTTWPSRPREDDLLFDLNGEQLTFEGLPAAAPLHVDQLYRCLMPRLTAECPDFRALKPLDDIIATSAAALDLTTGNLSAFQSGDNGPISTLFTHPSDGNVSIIGKRKGSPDRVIVVAPDAQIAIVNQPRDSEVVPNHFLAYYQLAAGDPCCTNVPFREPLPGCEAVKPGRPPLHKGDPDVMSTVACSNSNYP